MDHRSAGFGLALIIFTVAPVASVPRVGAFHHPSLRERGKAGGAFRSFLHFDPPPWPMLLQPGLQLMIVILAIAKDDSKPRKLFRTDLGEQLHCGDTIIHCGARDQYD